MKYLAGFLTLIVAIFSFLLPQIAHADSSSTVISTVTSQSSSTSNSSSQSTVDCNGKSVTSDNPNVNVQDHNGNCQVTFGDNAQVSSITATPEPTEENTNDVTSTPAPTDFPTLAPVLPTASPEATITPDPTIMQMRKDINNQVEKQVQKLKEHLKNQDQAISAFFQSGINTLQNLFQGFFR